MGWNSWCTDGLCNAFGDDICNEALVKSIVDAFVDEGMAEAGYEYVNLVREQRPHSTCARDSTRRLLSQHRSHDASVSTATC
jgi:hypothetical protein